MHTYPFTKVSDSRPFDLAKECLSPRLREHGGLDKDSLASSNYFKETVRYATEERFAMALSNSKVDLPAEFFTDLAWAVRWVKDMVIDLTGRELSFNEPLVAHLSGCDGAQQYPLIKISEKLVSAVKTALPSTEWRDKLKQQATRQEEQSAATNRVQAEDQEKAPRQPEVPKYETLRTMESSIIDLLSTVVHELIHSARGVQIGRRSTEAIRLAGW